MPAADLGAENHDYQSKLIANLTHFLLGKFSPDFF